MGANVWKTADAWPLPGTRYTDYYLGNTGQAESNLGDGTLSTSPPRRGEPADHYVVRTDGTVVNLNNGIVRASFRKSLSHPTPITPGKIYRYSITVWPSAYELAAGDQIRLEISSSDYPQFAPNPNTGARFGTTTRTRIARQTVLHDRAHPSEVTLPIIPADASSPSTPTFPMPSTK